MVHFSQKSVKMAANKMPRHHNLTVWISTNQNWARRGGDGLLSPIRTPPAPQRSHPPPTHGHHRAGPIPTPPEIKQAPCFEARQPLLHRPARPRSQNPPNHRNHQPHHSTHQPRPAALGWAPSHPARLTRPPTDQKGRLSTRTHLLRPPRLAAGRAGRAARLGRGSGSCTRNRAGGGPGVGSWLGFAP